ncbi:unnamed protein product [Orchesella dallaii]|uniref:F-box domain-containing protein n=1 Tax=Orchesella dallaii TaxID=48710 RepID=A0ABP1QLR0_9HEXA
MFIHNSAPAELVSCPPICDNMVLQINDLPNEVLCNILNFLNTNEKFLVRLVCPRWKDQIDENVSFTVDIYNGNYDLIRRRFGTSRCITCVYIAHYFKEDIPILNLASLKSLTVGANVDKLAVYEFLSKAISLECLSLWVDIGMESPTVKQTQTTVTANNYPVLRTIKKLHIVYFYGFRLPLSDVTTWKEILDEHMPNVNHLIVEVNVCPDSPLVRSFDYFRLVAGMPKLHTLEYRVWAHYSHLFVLNVKPLTPEISMGLAKLNLIRLEAIFVPEDEPIWNFILAKQHQIQDLNLSNLPNSRGREGFPISMILPVLRNCKQSLRYVSLEIDTRKNGDNIDMEMFGSLPFLRKLIIKAQETPFTEPHSELPNIQNCSTVLSKTLEKLSVRGFKFCEEDIICLIKNLSMEDLDTVRICPEYASAWKSFENRMEEMGIVRKEIKCSSSAMGTKVYVGAILAKYHKDVLEELLERDDSRRVKDVTVESQSLELVSRYM